MVIPSTPGAPRFARTSRHALRMTSLRATLSYRAWKRRSRSWLAHRYSTRWRARTRSTPMAWLTDLAETSALIRGQSRPPHPRGRPGQNWCMAALPVPLARPAWSRSSANDLTTAPPPEEASAQPLALLPRWTRRATMAWSPKRSCLGAAERNQRCAGSGEAADTAARSRRSTSIEPWPRRYRVSSAAGASVTVLGSDAPRFGGGSAVAGADPESSRCRIPLAERQRDQRGRAVLSPFVQSATLGRPDRGARVRGDAGVGRSERPRFAYSRMAGRERSSGRQILRRVRIAQERSGDPLVPRCVAG